jgi:hypothetical protein
MRVGSLIVAPYTRARTVIGRISSITPKKVRFEDIDRNVSLAREARPINTKYHHEVVCIDKLGEEVVMHRLSTNL